MGAGRRQDPRRRRVRARRCSQRGTQPSPVCRAAGPHPAIQGGHLRQPRDRGRAHHLAQPSEGRRTASRRRRRGLVHRPLRGSLAARRQERAAGAHRISAQGRGRPPLAAALPRVLSQLPRLPRGRLAAEQSPRLCRHLHRDSERRRPHPLLRLRPQGAKGEKRRALPVRRVRGRRHVHRRGHPHQG